MDGITEYGLHKELTVMRRTQEWMRAVPVGIQRAGVRDAMTAHKASVKYGRGRLRYRTSKHHAGVSVRCAQAPRVIDGHTIRLPCFGDVGVKGAISNKIMWNEPRSYGFVKTRSGRYVLYVSCRVKAPPASICIRALQTVKGIDRGAVEPTVAATLGADGGLVSANSYDTAAPFRDGRRQYQRMQSKMSKMNRHSNRSGRLHARLRKRLHRTLRQREYAECIAAKHVCTDHDPAVIILEDLKLGRMTRRGRGRRGVNREMRFVRHHMVEQRIRNRAEMAGIHVMSVDPRHTSQTCARCGHIDPKSRITRDMFKCARCNYIQQADVNAAMVIGGHGLPRAPSDADTTQQWQAASKGGISFVRRELDARLGCFTASGGSRHGGYESQVPAHSHVPRGARRKNVGAPS